MLFAAFNLRVQITELNRINRCFLPAWFNCLTPITGAKP